MQRKYRNLKLPTATPGTTRRMLEQRFARQMAGQPPEETFAFPNLGPETVQISQIDGRYRVGSTDWVGVDVPAHCTALGKVLYAFGALPVPRGSLERPTAHSPVDRAQLEHMLVEIRRRGWAASLDELEVGLSAVGAPVRSVDGSVVAAISVSGPTTRINEHGITKLGDMLVAELRGLSALLGHQPGRKEGVA